MPKKKNGFTPEAEKVKEDLVEERKPVVSEKERLLNLLKELQDLKVNRVSELENLIARAEG